jgi:hypothetical protein
MSYPVLTNKQAVVLESLEGMNNKYSVAHPSWSVAGGILGQAQNSQYWDAGIAQSSLEKSVAGILGYLERKGLVDSYFLGGPGHSNFKMWSLTLMGSEVAGEAI